MQLNVKRQKQMGWERCESTTNLFSLEGRSPVTILRRRLRGGAGEGRRKTKKIEKAEEIKNN